MMFGERLIPLAKNMEITEFRGYLESADLSKIPLGHLAFPSRNCLVTKNKVVTRGGLSNDGNAHTVDEAVHSEFVWRDAPGGDRPMRVHGTTLQVKHLGNWITIFTGLDAATTRVFFTTWVDGNTAVIKKRLFFCDGSANLYQWNGFIGTVESFTPNTVTFVADQANLGLMGADAGNVTAQDVRIYSLDANGDVDATELTLSYSTDVTGGLTMVLSGAPAFTPVANDLVISEPTTDANAVSSTFPIDVVYSYKNHVIAANYDRVQVYFSHIETYSLATGLNFTMPVAASRTALTPILMQLDGNFTAMIARKDTLWISDASDWYQVVKSLEQNAYDMWVTVEKFETGEQKGALPMAVAKHKGDIIYMAQDLTVQRITTLDIIGKDDILLLSDGVEALFRRLDSDDVRLYYFERGIFFLFPQESTMVILDTAEEVWYFQPPQDIPINCMSVIDGVKYGHHNGRNETYELFTGRNDLGADMAQAVIATGFIQGKNHFGYQRHDTFGLDIRLTPSTEVLVERYMEENGSKATTSVTFDGESIKTFGSDDDVSWATHPYGSRAWGGSDMSVEELRRAFVFDKERQDGHFETRPIITISGAEAELHLLGIYANEAPSPRNIGQDLFVPR